MKRSVEKTGVYVSSEGKSFILVCPDEEELPHQIELSWIHKDLVCDLDKNLTETLQANLIVREETSS